MVLWQKPSNVYRNGSMDVALWLSQWNQILKLRVQKSILSLDKYDWMVCIFTLCYHWHPKRGGERERKEKVVCMWLEHFLFTVKYIYYTFSVYVHNGSKKKFNDQV